MKITERTRIFKNEYGNYSTSISNRKEDGTYENMYIAVNFKKGVEVANNTVIDIKNGFLGFYKTKEGLPKLKIVVMEFEVLQEAQTQNNNMLSTDDDDLPF